MFADEAVQLLGLPLAAALVGPSLPAVDDGLDVAFPCDGQLVDLPDGDVVGLPDRDLVVEQHPVGLPGEPAVPEDDPRLHVGEQPRGRAARLLADMEPRAVLREGGLSEQADRLLFEEEVPVGSAEEATIREIDELAVTKESDVEAVIDDWERRAEQRRRERKAEELDRLISEHRARDPDGG